MSFAAAFEAIFDDIFGTAWRKPRIRCVDGRWLCTGPEGKTGCGLDPAMAYGAWCALAGR